MSIIQCHFLSRRPNPNITIRAFQSLYLGGCAVLPYGRRREGLRVRTLRKKQTPTPPHPTSLQSLNARNSRGVDSRCGARRDGGRRRCVAAPVCDCTAPHGAPLRGCVTATRVLQEAWEGSAPQHAEWTPPCATKDPGTTRGCAWTGGPPCTLYTRP